ncbi:unnamed protein product [Caretta caretta]
MSDSSLWIGPQILSRTEQLSTMADKKRETVSNFGSLKCFTKASPVHGLRRGLGRSCQFLRDSAGRQPLPRRLPPPALAAAARSCSRSEEKAVQWNPWIKQSIATWMSGSGQEIPE